VVSHEHYHRGRRGEGKKGGNISFKLTQREGDEGRKKKKKGLRKNKKGARLYCIRKKDGGRGSVFMIQYGGKMGCWMGKKKPRLVHLSCRGGDRKKGKEDRTRLHFHKGAILTKKKRRRDLERKKKREKRDCIKHYVEKRGRRPSAQRSAKGREKEKKRVRKRRRDPYLYYG